MEFNMIARKTLHILVVLLFLASFFTINVLSSPLSPPDALQALQQATGGRVRISYHAETGKVRFIGTDLAHPIAQPARLAGDISPEVAARSFLATYGALFGLTDPARELTMMRSRTQEAGGAMVRFQQVHQGIPVLGGELIVNMDPARNVLSANGEVLPDIDVSTTPAQDAEAARQAALQKVAKDYDLDVSALTATQPELWIYNPVLLGGTGPKVTSLVWRMDVQAKELLPIRELVLVEAHLGFVALHFNQIDTAKTRTVYDNQNTPNENLALYPAVCTEPGPCTGPGTTDDDFAFQFAGDTYDFYDGYHGRDSLDGAGMPLISTVRYCPAGGCPFNNAFWNGAQMVYGASYASADDVVGHEMTHGVTDHESRLFYYMQSGAINESFSDIWGEFIDQTNAYNGTGGGLLWLMGEDLPIGAIRSMSNPPAYGDPDKMSSPNYHCGTDDFGSDDMGGVHTNSGVSNKAAYLMANGGTFNGYNVAKLDITKTAKIFYKVQTDLFTSASDYQDLYDGLQQACTALIGTEGITAADCQEVKDAVDATEMNQQPASCAANEAPVCPAGWTVNTLFFDNLENPASGNWSSSVVSGSYNEWYYPQNSNLYGFDATYATSGVYNFWGYDIEFAASDFAMTKNANVALPPGSSPFLHFRHAFGFESGNYDGGVVEYRLDDSGPWLDAGALPAVNGYNGTINATFGNPLGTRQAFVNNSNGYISTRYNLGSLAGHNVRFRFRIGTDAFVGDWGWFLDDIRVVTCSSGPITNPIYLPLVIKAIPPPTAPNNLVAAATSSSAIHLTWTDNASNETGFRLERSPNGSSWSLLTTLPANTSSYDNTGLPASMPYYYRVRAYSASGDSAWSNTASATTLGAGPSLCNGNFEQGGTCWTQFSTHFWDIIINSGFPPGVTPHSGSWAAWLGGDYNDISYVQQQVTVPAGSPYLAYYHWIASQDTCGWDFGRVLVNSTTVDVYNLCSSQNTGGWVKHVVNLSAYSGQSVTLQIRVETNSDLNSNLFVDDVAFQSSPAAALESGPGVHEPAMAQPRR